MTFRPIGVFVALARQNTGAGAFPVVRGARPPNVFDALLSLKTVISTYADRMKNSNGVVLTVLGQWSRI